MSGGFLGVDIFFVISGFLITSLILIEKRATNGFSFLNFYERRARRLLPALFVVIFASWPVAWGLLMPTEIMDFVKSQIASVFFASNMYWHSEALTYGGRSGLFEPFLHTWSLAVEEQFYIFFPIAYLLALRFIRKDAALLMLGLFGILAGLIFAQIATTQFPKLSFYWLPSRAWELLAGAVLAHFLYTMPDFGRRRWALRILPPAGLALILIPMFVVDLTWAHPGLITIPSVLGTVVVIWFANPKDFVTRFLSSRALVFVGLISYSLYLWHYPIFAFGRMLDATPTVMTKFAWLGLSFALAYLSYRFVERPFRSVQTISLGGVITTAAASVVAVMAFASTMFATEGLRERFPGLIELYGKNEFDNEILRARSWQNLSDLAAADLKDHDGGSSTLHESEFLWFDLETENRKVLIVGDSHSKDMFNAFTLNGDLFSYLEFARFGMHARLRQPDIDRLFAWPNFGAAETIILSFRYASNAITVLPDFIEQLEARGKNVVMLLNTVEIDYTDNMPVFDYYMRRTGEPFDTQAINELAWQKRALERIERVNSGLRDMAADLGIIALEKVDFICDAQQKTCAAATPDGYKSFYDYGHYTLQGAQYFGQVIAETGWLQLDGPRTIRHGPTMQPREPTMTGQP